MTYIYILVIYLTGFIAALFTIKFYNKHNIYKMNAEGGFFSWFIVFLIIMLYIINFILIVGEKIGKTELWKRLDNFIKR